MKKLKKHTLILLLTLGFITNSCIDTFDVKTIGFENALVVEALITNEFKIHQIKLSSSFTFEEVNPQAITNAVVYITDDKGGRIDFVETFISGEYNSNIPFAAEAGKIYQLFITTSDNNTYESKAIPLSAISQIDSVYVERGKNNFNENGVSIFIDSYDPTGGSNYYRYEYEETYKIIAPKWSQFDLIMTSSTPPYQFDFLPKNTEKRICYKTEFSTGITLTETTDLLEDRVGKFKIRFINNENPIISHRYSILVKQYVQSIDTYTYFKTLKKFSTPQNGIAQNQPGFFEGNMRSSNDSDRKIIGIFDVSSVSEKRMYFNYKDLFVGENLPPYFSTCGSTKPSIIPEENSPPDLVTELENGGVNFYLETGDATAPYELVPSACGDCTLIGTNVKPDFWYE
ncbi:DUF4249 domain-containing protein [Aureibaculum luteum]|uniref:DUF4249 domain-containing protein n=1 Tax=Aureibaculum luteum TaxID=1548456 RepID=UPI000E53FA87|nr:DUF4249 domain-containing protein [Aureibaculum luteum]